MMKHTHFYTRLVDLLPKLHMSIWDLDGTLVINNEATALTQIGNVIKGHVRSNYGYKDNFSYHSYAGLPLPSIRQLVEQRLQHINIKLPEELDNDILDIRKMSPAPNEKVKVHPFFKTVLGAFRKAALYQCIATGSEPDRAARYVRAAGIRNYFESEDYLHSGHKPDPKCYIAAMNSFTQRYPTLSSFDPKRVISFEDSLSGVRAGVAAGVQVIGHLMATHIAEERKDDLQNAMIVAGAAGVIRRAVDAPKILLHVLEHIVPAGEAPKAPRAERYDAAQRPGRRAPYIPGHPRSPQDGVNLCHYQC